jgi:hypothetical protein
MTDHFYARITYAPEYAKDGNEWSQIEGFQNMDFLTSYLNSMGWRITDYKIIG